MSTHTLKMTVAGALISGVAAVTGLWPAAGTAQAVCDPICHGTWCPGDPVPYGPRELAATWDASVCHEYHQVHGGGYAEGPLPPDAVRCPPISFLCP